MAQGLLIALEGIDGSGTTTQGATLAEALAARGLTVHLTAEPSVGPVGEVIRRVLRGELSMSSRVLAMLFAADRIDHLEREIAPQLDRGAVVISDRYLLSSLAYQSLDNPLDWVIEQNRLARRADLNVLLRVTAETAARRRAARGAPDERFDALDLQRKIATAYDRVSTLANVGPTAALNGELERDAVAADLLYVVDDLFARSSREAAP
ncbi:MAG: dTMP kinase [Deltaproteobacteria bacterium]|nr:dTMP kinase [Deltaproteobacteria bacterium]